MTLIVSRQGNCRSTPIDLIVVDNIVPIRDPDTGKVTSATGGRRRVWTDWTPLQSDLKASTYDYTLPLF